MTECWGGKAIKEKRKKNLIHSLKTPKEGPPGNLRQLETVVTPRSLQVKEETKAKMPLGVKSPLCVAQCIVRWRDTRIDL